MRAPSANPSDATKTTASWRAERGATAVEYAILGSLVAAVIAITVAVLGGIVFDLWQVSW